MWFHSAKQGNKSAQTLFSFRFEEQTLIESIDFNLLNDLDHSLAQFGFRHLSAKDCSLVRSQWVQSLFGDLMLACSMSDNSSRCLTCVMSACI
jgi:hypothetical protein